MASDYKTQQHIKSLQNPESKVAFTNVQVEGGSGGRQYPLFIITIQYIIHVHIEGTWEVGGFFVDGSVHR